jgi:hypothetical protein
MTFPPVPGADWFLHSLKLQATTGPGGFALQDATPEILSWLVPDDGMLHRVTAFAAMDTTSATTGGDIGWVITMPDGTQGFPGLMPGGQADGFNYDYVASLLTVKPGSTVQITQGTPVSAGAAILWAELWGS